MSLQNQKQSPKPKIYISLTSALLSSRATCIKMQAANLRFHYPIRQTCTGLGGWLCRLEKAWEILHSWAHQYRGDTLIFITCLILTLFFSWTCLCSIDPRTLICLITVLSFKDYTALQRHTTVLRGGHKGRIWRFLLIFENATVGIDTDNRSGAVTQAFSRHLDKWADIQKCPSIWCLTVTTYRYCWKLNLKYQTMYLQL